MAMPGLYYNRSGRFKFYSPIALFLGCGFCSIVAGVTYGIGNFYSPSAYLNLFLPLVMGFGLGGLIYLVAKWTHNRNTAMVISAGLVCGLLLEYSAFVAWILVVSGWNILVVLPQDILYVLGELAELGVWEISGIEFKGFILYAAWVLEVGFILGTAVVFPLMKLKPMAYCESCRRWVTGHKSILAFELIDDPAGFREQLERGEFAVLGSLAAVLDTAPEYTSYDLSNCTGCNDLHLLSIEMIKNTVDNDGKTQTNKIDVIRNLLIDAESRGLIEELAPDETVAGEPAPDAAQATEQDHADPRDLSPADEDEPTTA